MEEGNNEKTDLRRRLEDLQSEVKHLQTLKFEKEEKLKNQIHKNEGLLEELERLNMAMTQVKEEREMTIQIKIDKEREIEVTQRQVQKIKKMGERVFKNVRNVQKLTHEFNAEFKLKTFVKEAHHNQ